MVNLGFVHNISLLCLDFKDYEVKKATTRSLLKFFFFFFLNPFGTYFV